MNFIKVLYRTTEAEEIRVTNTCNG